jgi:hypothetical protein
MIQGHGMELAPYDLQQKSAGPAGVSINMVIAKDVENHPHSRLED